MMASARTTLARLYTRASPLLVASSKEGSLFLTRTAFSRCIKTSCCTGMKYTKDHEWILEKSGSGRVGVTKFAQEQLGELVYVELPEVDREFSEGDAVGSLESVKAASDLLTPVSGIVTDVNEELSSNPSLINASPESEGWIYDIKLTKPEELDSLMDAEEYDKFVKETEDH